MRRFLDSEQAASPKEQQRLRLAYFSPLPPAPSGVADYSWDLLPHLAQLCDVTLFVPDPSDLASVIRQQFEIRPLSDFSDSRQDFDLPLYQMGNSIQHEFVYHQALRYPGILVLHDYFIGHLLAQINGNDRLYGNYVRELGYSLGQIGVDLAWQVRYGKRPYPLFSQPLNSRLVDRALGIIVHSHHVANLLRNRQPHKLIGVIPQLMPAGKGRSLREQLPATLNIQPDSVIFASLGQVTANKRLDLALRAFRRVLKKHPSCRYLVIGAAGPDVDLPTLIRDFGLEEAVHWTGRVPDLADFNDWLATTDIVINLREPTLGETSAAVLRAMSAGKPTIVYNHGWYSEIPHEACVQVRPDDQDKLYQAMLNLVEKPDLRDRIGHKALSIIQREHHPANSAHLYVDFIQSVLSAIDDKVTKTMSGRVINRGRP